MITAERIKEIFYEDPRSIEGRFIDQVSDYIHGIYFPIQKDGKERWDSFPASFGWDLTAKVIRLIHTEIDAYIEEYMRTNKPPCLWEEDTFTVKDFQ